MAYCISGPDRADHRCRNRTALGTGGCDRGLRSGTTEDSGTVSALDIPAAVLRCATHAAEDLRAVTGIAVDAHEMLTGRAALLDIAPSGRVSAGGATQLFRTRDGWCALTLSRDDDVAAVPALVQSNEIADPWLTVRRWACTQRAD